MQEGSIYMDLLGADFDRLGPLLQFVHGCHPNVHASGVVDVTHGKGLLVRFANWLSGVPAAKEKVPLQLEIRRNRHDETWIRSFEGKPLVTKQWAENGLFMESTGRVRLGMRLRVDQGVLKFEPVHTKVLGITLPRTLGVSVQAEVNEKGNGWSVWVETRSGLLGVLFRYNGFISIAT